MKVVKGDQVLCRVQGKDLTGVVLDEVHTSFIGLQVEYVDVRVGPYAVLRIATELVTKVAP